MCFWHVLLQDSIISMTKRVCCVHGCGNSGYHLKKWHLKFCEDHNCNFGTGRCTCKAPFQLLPFPNESKFLHARSIWIHNVNRKNENNKIWVPNSDSRVCTKHFCDEKVTDANPYPTLHMGHTNIITKSRPPPKERSDSQTPSKKRKSLDYNEEDVSINNYNSNNDPSYNIYGHDHAYYSNCDLCKNKDVEIKKLKAKIKQLQNDLEHVKRNVNKPTMNVLKNDHKVKYYTGIPSVQSFNDIYSVIEPCVKNVRYWKGPKYQCNILYHKKVKKQRINKKLTAKDEMILTMMKLRLGLLDEDIADRFHISKSHVSRIFTTWIQVLSKCIGSLVFNPAKDVTRTNLPPKFKTPKYSAVRHIIDCSEIFIETPHNLEVQAKTWSDYKHHHTAKYLVSITPAGMINFISNCWGGRTSDKHIVLKSGFLDIIEPYDTVLADRGFQINNEITLLLGKLLVPPGKRGAVQMTKDEVLKTKEIANRRIYIEQAIRRMKTFRILKFEVPLTLCQHLDHIIQTVAGICNLYPPLPKYD